MLTLDLFAVANFLVRILYLFDVFRYCVGQRDRRYLIMKTRMIMLLMEFVVACYTAG